MPYTKQELNNVEFYQDFVTRLRSEYLTKLQASAKNDFRDSENVLYSFEDIFRDTDENFDRGIEEADINQNSLYNEYITTPQLNLAKSNSPSDKKYPVYDKTELLENIIDTNITELTEDIVADSLPSGIINGDAVTDDDPIDTTRWLIENNQKRLFKNLGEFYGRGFTFRSLKALTISDLDSIPDGDIIG